MVWLWLRLAMAAMPLSGTGICTYDALLVASSQPSVDEVQRVGRALQTTYGVTPHVLRTPTATELWKALRELREQPRCAAVIVYVAAHRAPRAWSDGQWRLGEESGDYSAFPLRSLREALRELPADHVWLVADAKVPDHWFAPSAIEGAAPQSVSEARARARKRGRWVLASGGSPPGEESSRFADAFVDTLRGAPGRYHTPASLAATLQLALTITGAAPARVGQMWDQASMGGELVLVNQRTPVPEGVRPMGAREVTASGLRLRWVPAAYAARPWRGQRRRPPLPTLDGVWVTQGAITRTEWARVMNDSREWPFPDCGSSCPATGLTWVDSVRLANATSEAEGLEPAYDVLEDGSIRWVPSRCGYRLLTAAERNALVSGTSAADHRREQRRLRQDAPLRPRRCGERGPYHLCTRFDEVAEWLWDGVPRGRLQSRGSRYEAADPRRSTDRSGTRLARPAEPTCGG